MKKLGVLILMFVMMLILYIPNASVHAENASGNIKIQMFNGSTSASLNGIVPKIKVFGVIMQQ